MSQVLSERYALIEEIGVGGFSSVHRARDLKLERDVAIKILKSELLKDPTVIDRFMSEAKINASLKHPNSLQIFDYGQGDNGSLYIVSELLEGETLFDKMSREGPLDIQWLLPRIKPLCMALEEAHQAHIIHRDLKPENVFIHAVGQEERLVIIDFGISKLINNDVQRHTQTGQLFGTPMYMSPEQITRPHEVTKLSDLYSLGALIFHALAGKPPFDSESVFELLSHHVKTPPPLLSTYIASTPPKLDELISILMAKHAQDRPQSAHVLDHLLSEVISVISGIETTLDDMPPPESSTFSRRQSPDTIQDQYGRSQGQSAYPLWLISLVITVLSALTWIFIIQPKKGRVSPATLNTPASTTQAQVKSSSTHSTQLVNSGLVSTPHDEIVIETSERSNPIQDQSSSSLTPVLPAEAVPAKDPESTPSIGSGLETKTQPRIVIPSTVVKRTSRPSRSTRKRTLRLRHKSKKSQKRARRRALRKQALQKSTKKSVAKSVSPTLNADLKLKKARESSSDSKNKLTSTALVQPSLEQPKASEVMEQVKKAPVPTSTSTRQPQRSTPSDLVGEITATPLPPVTRPKQSKRTQAQPQSGSTDSSTPQKSPEPIRIQPPIGF